MKIRLLINKTISLGNLSINIPENFEAFDDMNGKYSQMYKYVSSDYKDSCTVYITLYEDYSAKNIRKSLFNGFIDQSNIEYSTKTINGMKWKYGRKYVDEIETNYSYSIIQGNILYNFLYTDFGHVTICDELYPNIVNSLTIR